MKLLYYITLFFLGSCASQKAFIKSNKNCGFNNPFLILKDNEKIFNKEKYDSVLKIQPSYVEDKKDVTISISKYRITKKELKSNFQKFIAYYPSGKIKYYYNFIENINGQELKIGKQVFYNENSEIIKVVDFEKEYNICWIEALDISKRLAKKEIKENNITDFIITRGQLNEKPKWIISLIPKIQNEEDYTNNYVIDGVTGQLTKTYKVRTIYDDLN